MYFLTRQRYNVFVLEKSTNKQKGKSIMDNNDYVVVSKAWYNRACAILAKYERKEADENGRIDFDDSSIQAAVSSYTSRTHDKGASGRGFEVAMREYMRGEISRVRPQGAIDISAKCGAIECKSGAGWLVSPVFDDKDAALDYYNSTRLPMKGARYIAYIPKFYGDVKQARMFKQREFLDILESLNLVTAKRSTAGGWGIAIQTYSHSQKKSDALFDALESGETIDHFIMNHVI